MYGEKVKFQELISKRMHGFRLSNNLSQEKMSELLHISERAYREVEKGNNFVSAMTLIYFIVQTDEYAIILDEFYEIIYPEKKIEGVTDD